MATLLYHWDFTGENNLSVGDKIYDSESNLEAEIMKDGTPVSSSISRNEDGIYLNNDSSENSGIGYYIDLNGLDNINLGGDISIEMVIKNLDTDRQGIYFQTIRDDVSSNSETAYITCQFKDTSRMKFRTNTSSISGPHTTKLSSKVINSTDEFHYIFSIYHDTINSSIISTLFINGLLEEQKTDSLKTPNEIPLSDIKRGVNYIGRQKNLGTTSFLKGVVKYIKIYENAITDVDEAYSKYLTKEPANTKVQKIKKRHTDVENFFVKNADKIKFSILGSDLGLSNNSKSYVVHKFSSGETINIVEQFNYIPLTGKDEFIICKFSGKYYKVTQTSESSEINEAYKLEISDNGSSYNLVSDNYNFDDTYSDDYVNIKFGGLEINSNNSEICFHENTIISTNLGKVKIKDLKSYHMINNSKIIYLLKSDIKPQNIVLIEKNAFGYCKPNNSILVTKNHTIFINNRIIPIYYFINGTSIRLVKNTLDVYNIIMLNNNKINISNIEFGVISMSNKKFKKLKKLYKKGVKEVNITLDSNNKFLKPAKIKLNLMEFAKFKNT